jgi:beta-lactamase class D
VTSLRGATAAAILLLAGGTLAAPADDLARIFESRGITATFIAESVLRDARWTYNESRSRQRFAPASTFKILNTLVALDAGVANVDNTVFEWDGVEHRVAAWNGDHSLASAFRVSCVWCYRQLAREIGRGRYEQVLGQLAFGNQLVGERIDYFWLDGSLRISAAEQVAFLRGLVERRLPFAAADIEAVESFMLAEQTDDYAIYGKTGWAMTSPQVAWYVGFARTAGETWLFALNLQPDSDEQASLRRELALEALRSVKIIP